MRAVWNDTVIAESDDTKVIEGNHYFPHDSLIEEHFKSSGTHTTCPWKGVAWSCKVAVILIITAPV